MTMAVALSASARAAASLNQLAGGFARRRALAQRRENLLLRQRAVHTVAAQQVAIMHTRTFGAVIGAQDVLRADGARQRMRGAGRAQGVVARQQGEFLVAQSVNARVANVEHMGPPPAQHQCTESARHAVEFGIGAARRRGSSD